MLCSPADLVTRVSMSNKQRKKEVLVHGKEFKPTEPTGRLSLAYRELKDLPTEAFARPLLVKILDLSHNELVYPITVVYIHVCVL